MGARLPQDFNSRMVETAEAETMDIDEILGLFEVDELADLIIDMVRDGYRRGYAIGRDEVGETEPTRQDPFMISELEQHIIQLSEKTMGRLTGNLKQALLDGVANRESIDEISSRIKEEFIGLQDWESERIARTEISNAMNSGRNAAWIESGRVTYKVWWNPNISSIRTADDSKRFHGQIQELDKPFVDIETGEVVMTPPNRPNCRCGMRPLQELPKNVVVVAGQMYDRDAIRKEASIYKDVAILDIVKAWTAEPVNDEWLRQERKQTRQVLDGEKDGKKKDG